MGKEDETNHSMEERQEGRSLMGEETDSSRKDGAIAGGRAPCCSLGLGVYGNGSKHDISLAASGTTPASNDSPAAQWVVKLQPPELSPSPTTTSRHQPGAHVLTPSPAREDDV